MPMSEMEIKIDMTPGKQTNKETTLSYHRPLQVYSKAFSKAGFGIVKIEEWISHRKSVGLHAKWKIMHVRKSTIHVFSFKEGLIERLEYIFYIFLTLKIFALVEDFVAEFCNFVTRMESALVQSFGSFCIWR